jgi:hypothetical protein
MAAYLAGRADYIDEAESLVEGWWENRQIKRAK